MRIIMDELEVETLGDGTFYVRCLHGDMILDELPAFIAERIKFKLAKYGILNLNETIGVHYDQGYDPTGTND